VRTNKVAHSDNPRSQGAWPEGSVDHHVETVQQWLTSLGVLGVVNLVIYATVIPWILRTKRDSTAATAWVLIVLLVPLLGAVLFWIFGYNHVYLSLQRKRRHRAQYLPPAATPLPVLPDQADYQFSKLASRVDAFALTPGNQLNLYSETSEAFAAILEAVRAAQHHIHLEFFIFRDDETGRALLDIAIEKAKQGIEVRLLVDGIGTGRFRNSLSATLLAAGGKLGVFLPLNPLLLRIRVNMRNHRKIVVVDGRVGFTGGMNIGNEYLGKVPRFGYWRDTFLRIDGPATRGLQRTFLEDWDFATGETVQGERYFPLVEGQGSHAVQVAASGPDQDTNTNRELYFAAILGATRRIWIASPYFVPDAGLFDALRLACFRGVEVRLLTLFEPDHFVSYYAGSYFWADLLAMGAQVYQYQRGMMHSKIVLIDNDLALVGSANFDNRSLHLNFEATCVLYSSDLVTQVEQALERDWKDAKLLDLQTYNGRSRWVRLAESACRLFAPIL